MADSGWPRMACRSMPVSSAVIVFHCTRMPPGVVPKMGARTESMSWCSSICAASFSLLDCIRSSLSRTSTLLRTSSRSPSRMMSLTSSPRLAAASTSHLSHGPHLPRTESVKMSKEERGWRRASLLMAGALGLPPHRIVAATSGRNHMRMPSSATGTHSTPAALEASASRLESTRPRLSQLCGRLPRELMAHLRWAMEAMRDRWSVATTSPTVENLPAK
mmetsp:Transcript_5032/g.16057  ORF Transcript_5032/g.16057 Transcript_5032/m.16057 type:complete len:219 (-) Transcript_5032:1493-2149(-)